MEDSCRERIPRPCQLTEAADKTEEMSSEPRTSKAPQFTGLCSAWWKFKDLHKEQKSNTFAGRVRRVSLGASNLLMNWNSEVPCTSSPASTESSPNKNNSSAEGEITFQRKSSLVTAQPVFGELAFDNGNAKFCILSNMATAQAVLDHVVVGRWHLQRPNLEISIMGGAGKMVETQNFDIGKFSKGVVEAALRTKAWVITGGTRSGVMHIIGKAMKEHDKQRQVPCIGIVPFGGLKTSWRELLESAEQSEQSDGVVEATIATAQKKNECPEERLMAHIEENHTHIICCDDGERGFGSEVSFRAEFEEVVGAGFPDFTTPNVSPSRDVSPSPESDSASTPTRDELVRKREPTSSKQIPRVMILVNGGKVSIKSIDAALDRGCPVVVCRGTGRIADAIVYLLDNLPEEGPRITAQISSISSPSLTLEGREISNTASHFEAEDDDDDEAREMFDAFVETAMHEHMGGDLLHAEEIDALRRIVKSGMIEVYASEDRFEDVILRAVLGNSKHVTQGPGVEQQLALAVRWGCSEFIQQLFRRLVETHSKSDPRTAAFAAIKWVFLNVVARRQEETTYDIDRQSATGDGAVQLVVVLLKDHHNQMGRFKVASNTIGAIHWDRIGHQDEWDGIQGLLLWAIEQEAQPSIVEAIWRYSDDPLHAALAAASCCRETAERAHGANSYMHNLAKKEMDDLGDRFEHLAILLLEELGKAGKALDYIFQPSMRWQGCSAFKLGHQLDCKRFVSSKCYRLAVDLYWMTPVGVAEVAEANILRKAKLDHRYQSFSQLLTLVVDFEQCKLTPEQFFSVPYIKCLVHTSGRMLFIWVYSSSVWYGRLVHGGITFAECVLLLWGLGYAVVEVDQYHQQGSLRSYLSSTWNLLDVVHIGVLLLSLVAAHFISDRDSSTSHREHTLESVHALNLIPSYFRLLQSFQFSEYFGTLLLTILRMLRDTANFLMILSIFCIALGYAITPLLFTAEERSYHGILWTFWTIFGNLNERVEEKVEEKIASAANTTAKVEENVQGAYGLVLYFIAKILLYFLMMLTNVILVNLLIAVMSSTYEKTKEESHTEWAFNRVKAVIEFDETANWPPPLNLLLLLQRRLFEQSWGDSMSLKPQKERMRGGTMRRRSMSVLGLETRVADRDLKDAQQKALQISRSENEDEASEIAQLRIENKQLVKQNAQLKNFIAEHVINHDEGISKSGKAFSFRPNRTEGTPLGRLASHTLGFNLPADGSRTTSPPRRLGKSTSAWSTIDDKRDAEGEQPRIGPSKRW